MARTSRVFTDNGRLQACVRPSARSDVIAGLDLPKEELAIAEVILILFLREEYEFFIFGNFAIYEIFWLLATQRQHPRKLPFQSGS
jgi:hypothetical protein